MAHIIELKPDQRPPPGRDWVMVSVLPPEHASDRRSIVRHSSGATFYTMSADDEVGRTIDRAANWADAHSVDNVYVQRTWAGRR